METTVRTPAETHHVIIHSSAREAMNTNEVILLKHVPKEFLLTIDSLCSQRDLIAFFCWVIFQCVRRTESFPLCEGLAYSEPRSCRVFRFLNFFFCI